MLRVMRLEVGFNRDRSKVPISTFPHSTQQHIITAFDLPLLWRESQEEGVVLTHRGNQLCVARSHSR